MSTPSDNRNDIEILVVEDSATQARQLARLLETAGYRVRVAADGEVWFLEANANPFISYGHDMANSAAKAGMEYYDFVERLVDIAVSRDGRS